MTNESWGTKRTCPSCSVHFYDLNKTPAVCPKCQHQFDPALALRGKRKPTRRGAPEEKKVEITATILAKKTAESAKKKDKKSVEADSERAGDDIAEIDEDDIESLQEIGELEEREATKPNEDDADDETIIEELDTGGKALVGNVEEEEAKALGEELDEEDKASVKKAMKARKKSK